MSDDSIDHGQLHTRLSGLSDVEGERLPSGLPQVVDAHVHLFPDGLFDAVWSWFETHGWPIRYRLYADRVIAFLRARGVSHIVALHYAHKPGVARELNRFMAQLARRHAGVTALATVLPGEPEATRILEEGFDLGLRGVKLHPHVQCCDLVGRAAQQVYACCAANSMPLVMHAGREPKSPAYACDPYLTCGAAKVDQLLRENPALQLCVPHLGADEFLAFHRLVDQHDNLWLDSTMALADYLPGASPPPLDSYRLDRILYGTDFPNIPYAWDRELQRILALGLPAAALEQVLSKNAIQLFGLPL